jgi:hypothetical protein
MPSSRADRVECCVGVEDVVGPVSRSTCPGLVTSTSIDTVTGLWTKHAWRRTPPASDGQLRPGQLRLSRLPFFAVFDDENVTNGPLGISMFSYNVVKLGYHWSQDNQTELDRG